MPKKPWQHLVRADHRPSPFALVQGTGALAGAGTGLFDGTTGSGKRALVNISDDELCGP